MRITATKTLLLYIGINLVACGDAVYEEPTILPYNEIPQIGIDGNGNAVAVWQRNTRSKGSVAASIYSQNNGWGKYVTISDDEDGTAWKPRIAVDSIGAAVVVWLQGKNRIVGKIHTSEGQWSAKTILDSTEEQHAFYEWDVATSDNGHTMAVFVEDFTIIRAARYTHEDGWSKPELVAGNDIGRNKFLISIDINENGDAVLAWLGEAGDIWISRHVSGAGWGSSDMIASDIHGSEMRAIAIDFAGDVMAVWSESKTLWAKHYATGSGWSSATQIHVSPTDDSPLNLSLAINQNGYAVTVWMEAGSVWSNEYQPDMGWGTAQNIGLNDKEAYPPVKIAMDSSGNAVAVWMQHSIQYYPASYSLVSNRYRIGSGWETAEQLARTDETILDPNLGLDRNGNAIAMWRTGYGIEARVWANRYTYGTGWGKAVLVGG